MLKFNLKDFASVGLPTKNGITLIVQYLNNKYQSNINCPVASYSFQGQSNEGNFLQPIPKYVDANNYVKIKSLISEARNKSSAHFNYREAYILSGGSGTEQHAVFMVYITEKGREGILFSDSLGSSKDIAENIQHETGIKVYYTPQKRQADMESCYIDALVFGRDTTGIDPETGEYLIPNLLSFLKTEAGPYGQTSVKLPNELLKTAQLSEFVSYHKNHSDKKIHKDETIDEFRLRYSRDQTKGGTTKKISTYLSEKGNKYTKIMAIQFYLNEIEKELGYPLKDEVKINFIKNAKKVIKIKALHHFSEDFLTSISEASENLTSSREMNQLNKLSSVTKNTGPDNWSVEKLAEKYNLPPDELRVPLHKLIQRVDNSFQTPLKYDARKTSLENTVLDDLMHITFGLAFTEFLLHYRPHLFSGMFCIELVQTAIDPTYKWFSEGPHDATPSGNYTPSYVNLILDDAVIINRMAQRGELYAFGQKDAYIAARLLTDYNHLLNENEQNALQWVVSRRSQNTSYLDEMNRMQSIHDASIVKLKIERSESYHNNNDASLYLPSEIDDDRLISILSVIDQGKFSMTEKDDREKLFFNGAELIALLQMKVLDHQQKKNILQMYINEGIDTSEKKLNYLLTLHKMAQNNMIIHTVLADITLTIDILIDSLKQFWLDKLAKHSDLLSDIPIGLYKERSFVLAVMERYPAAYEFCPKTLREDKVFIFEMIHKNCEVIQFLPEALQKDKDFMFTVVKENPGAMYSLPEALQKDKEFLLSVVKENPVLRWLLPKALKDDKEFMHAIDNLVTDVQPQQVTEKEINNNIVTTNSYKNIIKNRTDNPELEKKEPELKQQSKPSL